MRNVRKNVSPRSTDWFGSFCWNDSACTPFLATTKQLFSQSLSLHTLCSCLDSFLPLTTASISGKADFSNAAPTRFAAGTIYLRKNGIAVQPISCASAPNPIHVVDQHLLRMESLFLLKQPSCNVFWNRNEF